MSGRVTGEGPMEEAETRVESSTGVEDSLNEEE